MYKKLIKPNPRIPHCNFFSKRHAVCIKSNRHHYHINVQCSIIMLMIIKTVKTHTRIYAKVTNENSLY